MEPEALLTFFGLVLAALAILSPERRLDSRVRLHWLDWAVAIAAIIAVHYITFYPVLADAGIAPDLGRWRSGFTPETASYLVLAGTAVFLAIRASRARLSRSKLSMFRKQTEQLLYSERFAELTFLLDAHWPRLVREHNSNYLLPRLKSVLQPSPSAKGFNAGEQDSTRLSRFVAHVLSRMRATVASLVPDYQASRETATQVLRRILLHDAFVTEMAKIQPYLVLQLLGQKIPDRQEFQKKWLEASLRNRDSSTISHHSSSESRGI